MTLRTRVPQELSARVPVEQRGPGLERDAVRLLVSRGPEVSHHAFRELPRLLRAGDLLVVNTSPTLPAAVDGWIGHARVVVHFSTRGDDGRWAVELREPDGRGTTRARAGTRADTGVRLPGGLSLRLEEPLSPRGERLWWARVTEAPRGGTALGGNPPETAPGEAAPATNPSEAESGGTTPTTDPSEAESSGAALGRNPSKTAPGGTTPTTHPFETAPGGATPATKPSEAAPRETTPAAYPSETEPGGAGVLGMLGRYGRPIRYSYTARDQPLEVYQTVFALPGADGAGSAEMPSAARPFTARMVAELVSRGVRFAPVRLHTGVASAQAHEPPYPERFAVPEASARLVNAARAGDGRVVAVGTTAVRAVESAVDGDGVVRARRGWTDLVVTPERGVRVVDGLLTGLHEPEASHLLMLEAVAGRAAVERGYEAAVRGGYLWHEFGDVHLLLPPDPHPARCDGNGW